MAMPNSAVTIGRPIASNEPNAMRRMNTAAKRPKASVAGGVDAVGEDVAAELDGEARNVHLSLRGLHAVGERSPFVVVEVDGVDLRVRDRSVL